MQRVHKDDPDGCLEVLIQESNFELNERIVMCGSLSKEKVLDKERHSNKISNIN